MAVLASFLRARCSNWLAGGGLLVLTLSAGLARPACAAQYNVGTGTGCTHSNLSDALIAAAGNPGLDTIHLLSGSTHQGQFLVAGPLTIEGGYASCTATTPTGFSSVVGDNANRALFVLVSNGAVVTLSRLQIHGGNVTGDGGGIYLTGQGSLLLSGTLVFSNTATGAGGGVYVNGASGLFVHLGGSSAITANSANRGGGLACSGATEIQLDQAELVGNNTATTDGGGVYLASSCALYSLAGGSFAGIAGNIAGNRGGGVYAETQANLNLDGSSRGLSALTGNQAVDGAGAYLTGVGTILRSYGGSITANTASSHGGGLFVDNGAGAYLTTGLNAFNGCTDMVRCSLLSANQAAIGGGLFVDHVSGVTLQATFVEHNTATLFSSVIGVAGGSSATFDSSVVAQNSGNEPFSADGTNTHLT
nr:hypothetical protein [Thermoanaerobaculia bacterium]